MKSACVSTSQKITERETMCRALSMACLNARRSLQSAAGFAQQKFELFAMRNRTGLRFRNQTPQPFRQQRYLFSAALPGIEQIRARHAALAARHNRLEQLFRIRKILFLEANDIVFEFAAGPTEAIHLFLSR